MKETIEQQEELTIKNFTIKDVLTTVQLGKMSKKDLRKHIEKLERIALGLDNGLTIAINELHKKRRAITGELV